MYVHITMNATTVPEACPTRKWRASVSNIGLTLEEDPLLNVGTLHNPLAAQTPQELEVELDPGCDRTRPWHPLIQAGLSVTQSVSDSVSVTRLTCLCQHQVWRTQHFNCHASFPASFATELTGNIHSLCCSFVPRVFEVISQLSHTMRKSVLDRR